MPVFIGTFSCFFAIVLSKTGFQCLTPAAIENPGYESSAKKVLPSAHMQTEELRLPGNTGSRAGTLLDHTGFRNLFVPVSTLFRIALLSFKIHIEEAITFLIAIGPGEYIHQRPQEVPFDICPVTDRVRQHIQKAQTAARSLSSPPWQLQPG